MFSLHPRALWKSTLFLSLLWVGCTACLSSARANPSGLTNLEQIKHRAGLAKDSGYEPTAYQRDPILVVDLVRDSAVQEPSSTPNPSRSRLQELVQRARQLRD